MTDFVLPEFQGEKPSKKLRMQYPFPFGIIKNMKAEKLNQI